MLYYVNYLPEYTMSKDCDAICTYSGGKERIYNYIAYLVYKQKVETFMELSAGAAFISLNIVAKYKIINDIRLDMSVIYKALSIPYIADNVLRRLKNTGYSEEVFTKATEYWEKNKKTLPEFDGQDLCDAAYYSWILHTFSRIGSKISKKFIDTQDQRKDFERFQRKLIKYYHKLDGALVLNENLLDILKKYVKNPDMIPPNTVIYIDPPYLPSIRRGVKDNGTYSDGNTDYKFALREHMKMLRLVDKLPRDKCKVIISGYDDVYGLYRKMLNKKGFGEWSMIFVKELPVMNGNGSKLKDGKRPRDDEYFFTNFKV